MTVKDVLQMIYNKKIKEKGWTPPIIQKGVVLNTNNSNYIEDWEIFFNKFEAIDNFLEKKVYKTKYKNYLNNGFENIVGKHLDYDGFFKDIMIEHGKGWHQYNTEKELNNKWILCDVKSYGENGKEKILYDRQKGIDNKLKTKELER